jgi:hypothetical protein
MLNHFALAAFHAIKCISLIILASVSCLDLQFESEYEDINGIVVEYVHSYTYLRGCKMLFDDGMGYITNAESLLVYDFSEVEAAVYKGHYSANSVINDFEIYDEYAVLATNAGMEIVDIRDSLPTQLSSVSFFLMGNQIRVLNNHAFVVSHRTLYLIDISDKQQPALCGSFEFVHPIIHVELDSNFAYVLADTDFHILNIENPSNPLLVSSTSLLSLGIMHPRVFIKNNGFVYFSDLYLNTPTLFACVLTQSNTLQPLDYVVYPDMVYHFHMSEQYILAVGVSDAYLIDLQNPQTPCISETLGDGGFYGLMKDDFILIFTPNLVVFRIVRIA